MEELTINSVRKKTATSATMISSENCENCKILKLAANHIKDVTSKTPIVFEKIHPRSIKREKIREVIGKAISPKIK